MNYHALIPVKQLLYAKSRLASHLPPNERAELVLSMLKHVITVLKSCDDISKIIVVTTDDHVRNYSLALDVSVDNGQVNGHNPALTAAATKELHSEKDGLFTISADLPLLTIEDIQQMIDLSKLYDIVLAPSKDNGTNALLVKTPLLIPYLFGENSFNNFEKAAKEADIPYTVHQSETIAFDIDTIEDIKKLNKLR